MLDHGKLAVRLGARRRVAVPVPFALRVLIAVQIDGGDVVAHGESEGEVLVDGQAGGAQKDGAEVVQARVGHARLVGGLRSSGLFVQIM